MLTVTDGLKGKPFGHDSPGSLASNVNHQN
jgi:hypothetical protein